MFLICQFPTKIDICFIIFLKVWMKDFTTNEYFKFLGMISGIYRHQMPRVFACQKQNMYTFVKKRCPGNYYGDI